jgi:exopolysaccharide biosynthesis polyprenyl glycosylphosphotransferase
MDVLLVNTATLIALRLWALRANRPFSEDYLFSQAYWFLFFTALWLLSAYFNDLYNLKVASDLPLSGLFLLRTTFLMLLVYLLIYFLSDPGSLPRLVVLLFIASSFVLIGLWRAVYASLLARSPSFQRKAIVVGAGWAGRTIVKAIEENLGLDYQLIGFVDDDPAKRGKVIEGLPVIGTRRDLIPLIEANDVSEVILAITHDLHGELFQALMDCQEKGLQITPMLTLYEKITGKVPVEHIGDNWCLALPIDHASTGNFFPLFKRTMDIILSSIGLIFLALSLPFIALAIYLDSPGPIFYTQERVGKGGKTYRLVKFRTMVPNAERDGEAIWAEKGDPRVTRVGRILRATHIDELPQLVNVFKGEMSLVGPRPERPEFVTELERKIPFYRTRHCVKPGMAGWALIKYGYSGSVEEALIKLQYDLYYIKHQSISLDVLILLKTILDILLFRGR